MKDARVHIALREARNLSQMLMIGSAFIALLTTTLLGALAYFNFNLTTILIFGFLANTLLIVHTVINSGRQHEIRLSYIEQVCDGIESQLEDIQMHQMPLR